MKMVNAEKTNHKNCFMVYPSGNENDKCQKSTNHKNCFMVYPSGNENCKC